MDLDCAVWVGRAPGRSVSRWRAEVGLVALVGLLLSGALAGVPAAATGEWAEPAGVRPVPAVSPGGTSGADLEGGALLSKAAVSSAGVVPASPYPRLARWQWQPPPPATDAEGGEPLVSAPSYPAPSYPTPSYPTPSYPTPLPDVWPWPMRNARVTQAYSAQHQGLDLSGRVGSAVFAVADGTVQFAGWSTAGYGYWVVVSHSAGLETAYAHLEHIVVSGGQAVNAGDQLGTMGGTGRSDGWHLHFEVRLNGVRQNPSDYLR